MATSNSNTAVMRAGFARRDITPPLGTPLMGWGKPRERLARRVNDPLYIRALWLQQGSEVAVIVTFDFCFVAREDTERWHGILARERGLLPRQVLFTASHTHAGPAMGTYLDLMAEPPLRAYLQWLDGQVLQIIDEARSGATAVTMHAARSRSKLPMSRRKKREDGRIVNGPNPTGPVHDDLSIVTLDDASGKKVCVLFSVATHPVCFSLPEISADYPGVAMQRIDEHFHHPCAMLLQGPAGDSRPSNISAGQTWVRGPGFEHTLQAGEMVAAEVLAALPQVRPVQPQLRSALLETYWPVGAPDQAMIQQAAAQGPTPRGIWGRHQLELQQLGATPQAAPILLHLLQLGPELPILGIEGEPLQVYGRLTRELFADAGAICVGYCHGPGLYLVSTPMLTEGGYEPESYWELHLPAPLAPGMEQVFIAGVRKLQAMINA
jgi:hypothetical protein